MKVPIAFWAEISQMREKYLLKSRIRSSASAFIPSVVRRIAIVSYEAEMNLVMYATRGKVRLNVSSEDITLRIEDEGPGIPDINLAMQEGYSTATAEMREMGFGAGMGLPNIRRNADEFNISSEVGQGTRLHIRVQQTV